MTAERVEPTSTQAPIASLGVGLPLARVLASTMDKTLPAFIGQLVLQGDLFSLENMRVALLEARPALHGSPMLWRIVGMSTAQWLGAEESDRKNFAYLWLDTFGVTGSVPDMARLALLLSLSVTKDIPFHLPAAKRLAELALGEGGDVSLQLSDVLERLLRQSKAATLEENGAWLELFKYLLQLDAQSSPGKLLEITRRPAVTTTPPVPAGNQEGVTKHSLFAALIHREGTVWLDAFAQFYGQETPMFRRGVHQAIVELTADLATIGPMGLLQKMEVLLLRRWLDADAVNALLMSTYVATNNVRSFSDAIRSFSDAIALESAGSPAWTTDVLEMVRRLHAAGGNLDIRVTTHRGHENQERWTATLLHKAVAAGSAELVALLLTLGCDPAKPAVKIDLSTKQRRSVDCFALVRERVTDGSDEDKACAHSVETVLLAWQAHQHANALLSGQKPGPANARH